MDAQILSEDSVRSKFDLNSHFDVNTDTYVGRKLGVVLEQRKIEATILAVPQREGQDPDAPDGLVRTSPPYSSVVW